MAARIFLAGQQMLDKNRRELEAGLKSLNAQPVISKAVDEIAVSGLDRDTQTAFDFYMGIARDSQSTIAATLASVMLSTQVLRKLVSIESKLEELSARMPKETAEDGNDQSSEISDEPGT